MKGALSVLQRGLLPLPDCMALTCMMHGGRDVAESLVESPPKGLRCVRLIWVCNCPEPFAAWFAERLLKLQRHANTALEQKISFGSTLAAAGTQLVKVELRLYSTGECTTVNHVIIVTVLCHVCVMYHHATQTVVCVVWFAKAASGRL
eukprot:3963182-Pyramimonas_sp.AAC.1